MSIFLVVLVSLTVLAVTVMKTERPVAVILSLAFLVRLLVFFADYYHLVPVPFSGADTEDFHVSTLAFVAGEGPIKTNYTYVLAFFYRIFGEGGRLMSQFFNVLMSFGTVALLYVTLRRLKAPRKLTLAAVTVLAFMPAIVCMSGALLRESMVQFFLMLSVYGFVRWYQQGGVGFAAVCLTGTYVAMMMHAGCIGVLPVYVLAFFCLRTWKTEGAKRYGFTVLLVIGFLALLPIFPELFLSKFANALTSMGGLNFKAGADGGIFDFNSGSDGSVFGIKPVASGSAYLLWIRNLSFPLKMLLSPLKMFYMLFSPLPFDWRNMTDAMVFFADSMVYLVLTVMMFWKPLFTKTSQLKRILIYAVMMLTFVFAIGTFSAGTAIRHRAKFVSVMLLTAVITKTPVEKTLRLETGENKDDKLTGK